MFLPAEKVSALRNIALTDLLLKADCVRDEKDNCKWHTNRGIISINGQKFFNWKRQTGGGGAIDLSIHLFDFVYNEAVNWLENVFMAELRVSNSSSDEVQGKEFVAPKANKENLFAVIRYLILERKIPEHIVKKLISSGKVYSDNKKNAVFLLLGKEKSIVGAELRGTTSTGWHGMARGSKKASGAFYIKSDHPKIAILCESAIDAISIFSIHRDCLAISTAGANPNPGWLKSLIQKNYETFYGFDSDETGDYCAFQMMRQYPEIKRLRPEKHDWNELLRMESGYTQHKINGRQKNSIVLTG